MKLYIKIALLITLIGISSCQNKSPEKKLSPYDIRNYGAKGDGVYINTKAIQEAIDICSAHGGGKVIVPNGTFKTGTVILKDNVTLHLEDQALILGSTKLEDYINIDPFIDAVGQQRGNCLIGAYEANNIAITGKGTIDGQGEEFTPRKLKEPGASSKRPFLIRFVRSKHIQLKGINIKHAAAWNCHLYQSSYIEIDNITITSHVNKNNDGIDIDSSSHVKITNSDIDTGDDGICIKATSPNPTSDVLIENCIVSSHWGAFKLGTESMGDFKNITIRNCIFDNVQGGAIKILSVDGSNISNINVENIKMKNIDMPIFIRLGERLKTYRNAPKRAVGSIDGVSIKNITVKCKPNRWSRVRPASGILITGTPDYKINNISLSNITISLPGEGKEIHKSIKVAELENEYPEFTKFGPLPAYGAYIRHAQNITLDKVSFKLKQEDNRDKFKFIDAEVSTR